MHPAREMAKFISKSIIVCKTKRQLSVKEKFKTDFKIDHFKASFSDNISTIKFDTIVSNRYYLYFQPNSIPSNRFYFNHIWGIVKESKNSTNLRTSF